MGGHFDKNAAQALDDWYMSPEGQACLSYQFSLIMRLLDPRPGQRLLDVGCGIGVHLQRFKRQGLTVTGIDSSPEMLALAEKRLGRSLNLMRGFAEDLPFEDNEFDVVTLINCLELVDNPEVAISEALRVARRRVFIGVINSLSLTGLSVYIRGFFRAVGIKPRRLYSLWELLYLVKRVAGPSKLHWSTAGLLPQSLAGRAKDFEARADLQEHCPFGSFLGLRVEVAYTHRTDNLVIESPMLLGKKREPSPTSYGPII